MQTLVTLLSVAFLILQSTAEAQDKIELRLRARQPQMSYANDGKTTIEISGLRNTVEGGLPSVPVKTTFVALPPGSDIDRVESTFDSRRSALRAPVELATTMIPITWKSIPTERFVPSEAPRIDSEFYPSNNVRWSVQTLHGVRLALIEYFPVRVVQKGLAIDLALDGKLTISLKDSCAPAPTRGLLEWERKEVEALIENKEVLAQYGSSEPLARGYDYLIVATKDLIQYQGEGNLSEFQKILTGRGLTSKVVDAASLPVAADKAESVRNFIRSEKASAGIRYVLLIGGSRESGTPAIPNRKLWSKIKAYMNGHWFDLEESIPADNYFACLDGGFNSNGNAQWGEPTDGDGGGDVDFLAEVSVGRVATDSTEHLKRFVLKQKLVSEKNLPKSTLLAGELLFAEKDLYGDDYLEQMVGSSTEHGLTTQGFGTEWSVQRLGDRVKEWTGSEALKLVNSTNFGMINHLGHSNEHYNLRLSESFSGIKFTNTNPFLYYSQGCLAGRFISSSGSIIDHMVTHAYGAAMAIGNSTYGLAPEDPDPTATKTPGASNLAHREFIHAMVTKQADAFGRLHQLSKEALIGLKNAQEIRWINWTVTYFGDPSLPASILR